MCTRVYIYVRTHVCLCIFKDIEFKAHFNAGWSRLEILTLVTTAKTYFQTGPAPRFPWTFFRGDTTAPLGCEGRAISWGGCEAAGREVASDAVGQSGQLH